MTNRQAVFPQRLGLWIALAVVFFTGALFTIPYKLSVETRSANVERCKAASDGARLAGDALQAIADGNATIADDPFQSAKTRLARRSENARLGPAIGYYRERQRLDCDGAYPKPSILPF